MNVSVIIPYRAAGPQLDACLDGIRAQRYDGGRIELLLVAHGVGQSPPAAAVAGPGATLLAVEDESPYVARNLAAAHARGDALLFTEPGCVAAPEWVAAHVRRLRDPAISVSVGHVAALRGTKLLDTFSAYESVRDAWVFSSQSWQHYFGRPKNMAVSRRRFESHGPFEQVMRGADSSFVQRVAREIGCDEIALTPDAVVRQRAVTGLPSCLRDRFEHSHAMRRHRSSHAAPIALSDRADLFRQTVARNGYGPLQAATLLALLAAGILAFRLGGWTAALSRPQVPAR